MVVVPGRLPLQLASGLQLQLSSGRLAPGSRCSRARRVVAVVTAAGRGAAEPDPYAVLHVARGSSRRQIREKYIQRIKLLHPDVSASGDDTTLEAAALNAAYDRVMAGFGTNSREDEDETPDPLDVFDRPEAEPDCLFVNPFACYNVSALQWEEVQAAAKEAEAAGRDPWSALQEQGVQSSEGAFVYLTPQQLAIVNQELERVCAAMDSFSMQAAAFFISDCLMRARAANNRMPSRSRW